MKKHFAAVAAIGWMVSTSALAQSSVRLSGLVDTYAAHVKALGAARSTNVVNGGGLSTSYFSFDGTEDLGGGLSARFALAAFFRSDSGASGRNDTDVYFSRDASVGLANAWGSITAGRASAPNFIPSVLANPFGNSIPFSPLMQHSNVNVNGWTYKTSPADTGWSNQVILGFTPVAGLRVNLQYQFGEQASDSPTSGRKNVGANFIYGNGPLGVVGYYERDQIQNPNPLTPITVSVANVAVPATKQVWMVGATYDLRFVKLYGTFGRGSTDVIDTASKTTSAGVSVPIGAGQLLAAAARTQVDLGASDKTRTTMTVGYDYNLSKRSDLYMLVMRDRATALSSGTSLAAGIRHRF